MNYNRIWRLKPPSPHAATLASKTGISPLNAQLLINRGISDADSAKTFISPKLTNLLDPLLLKDMDSAVDIIIRAISNKEHIAIFGDYDADGITATALLLNLFTEINVPASFYIPDRLNEGYGLNLKAVKELSDQGVGLIITVDCGISNVNEIEFAKKLGMNVIVTDHHQIPDDFKPLCPVINPNRTDSVFPFSGLSGVGVAFFLSIALRTKLRDKGWFKNKPEPDLRQYLDLVALGSVADMVPLLDQNRILVQAGMEVMADSRWPGITALKDICGIGHGEITSYDLAFKLAPRLNAPGRLGNISIALEALISDRYQTAIEAADDLNRMNIQRQTIEGDILEEIEEMLIPEYDLENRRALLLVKEGWHKGVLGIVASRLLSKYHRPTLIFTVRDGIATGSGRSIEGLDLYKALYGMKRLFIKFGGHYHAIGCTLKASNIDDLAIGLEEIAQNELSHEDMIPSVDVDMEISLQDLTIRSVKGVSELAPFGSRNPEPILYSDSLEVMNSRIVAERHLKLRVKQEGKIMDTIGFGLADLHPLDGRKINMIFTPQIDTWKGNEKIQLRINDLELSEGQTKLKRVGE